MKKLTPVQQEENNNNKRLKYAESVKALAQYIICNVCILVLIVR